MIVKIKIKLYYHSMKSPIIGITLDFENNGGYSKFPWYAIRENYLSCLSYVFNVSEGELSKGIMMMYKLVSNYDEMEAIDARIILLLNKGYGVAAVKKDILSIFDISEEDTNRIVLQKIDDVEMERLGGQRQMKIKNNL